MTQALALAGVLRDAGHQLSHVHVGLGPGWEIPDYFRERIGAPIQVFDGPTHVLDDDRAGVHAGRTFAAAITRLPSFIRGALARHREVTAEDTDVQVGFFDAVGGAARLLRPGVPGVVVAHHYVLHHPSGPRVPISALADVGLRLLTRITALASTRELALSFTELGTGGPDRLEVVPPLLRPELFDLDPTDDGFLLCYAVTPGIGNRIVEWQSANPDVPVHLFIAGGGSALHRTPGPGFAVHDLDDRSFLDHMARCRAFAGSAGFESLCEAYWLGKPVLAVPTPGQVEQKLNAVDAMRGGIARAGAWTDLGDFWATAESPAPSDVEAFRSWVASGPARFLEIIESAGRKAA